MNQTPVNNMSYSTPTPSGLAAVDPLAQPADEVRPAMTFASLLAKSSELRTRSGVLKATLGIFHKALADRCRSELSPSPIAMLLQLTIPDLQPTLKSPPAAQMIALADQCSSLARSFKQFATDMSALLDKQEQDSQTNAKLAWGVSALFGVGAMVVAPVLIVPAIVLGASPWIYGSSDHFLQPTREHREACEKNKTAGLTFERLATELRSLAADLPALDVVVVEKETRPQAVEAFRFRVIQYLTNVHACTYSNNT